MNLQYIPVRTRIPAVPCPGCGQLMHGEEGEHCKEEGSWGEISWACENPACPYGPRPLRPDEILVDKPCLLSNAHNSTDSVYQGEP